MSSARRSRPRCRNATLLPSTTVLQARQQAMSPVMLRHDHRAQSAERHILTRPILHTTESRQQVPPCVQQ